LAGQVEVVESWVFFVLILALVEEVEENIINVPLENYKRKRIKLDQRN
jgi:hypothetical protein